MLKCLFLCGTVLVLLWGVSIGYVFHEDCDNLNVACIKKCRGKGAMSKGIKKVVLGIGDSHTHYVLILNGHVEQECSHRQQI